MLDCNASKSAYQEPERQLYKHTTSTLLQAALLTALQQTLHNINISTKTLFKVFNLHKFFYTKKYFEGFMH